MAADEKWYFTKEHLANTPSRKCGYDADRELSCRQQAANFIQDMGQRLQVTQLCINTAIVYMHRFYVFHSFTQFHRNAMAAAALFLAAKVEEQPRKLEHVIKVAQMCLHREQAPLDTKSEQYLEQAQDLVMNENVLLQTLGFDVAIDHPHTHVVRCCHLVRASKDLAQTSYFMASNSLHLTTMCLQYKPTVVACFCIHLACKWSNWEIPQSNEGKSWFWYVDRTVTQELLEQLTDEFLRIFDKCPSRLKRKIMSISANQNPTLLSGYPFPAEVAKRDGQNKQCSESGQQNTPNFHQQQSQAVSAYRSRSGVPATQGSGGGDEAKKRLESNVPQSHQRPLPDYKKVASSSHHSSRDSAYSLGYHSSSSLNQSSASSLSSSSQSTSQVISSSSQSTLNSYGQNSCSQGSINSSQSFGSSSQNQILNNQISSSSSQYSSQGQNTKTSLGHLIESTPALPSNKIGNGSRPECMFPPPMRSHHSTSRPTKPESQSSTHHVPQYKQPHPTNHHPPRNGTSHVQESSIVSKVEGKPSIDIKPFAEGKPFVSHQKSHVKSYESRHYPPGVSSVNSANYGSRIVTSDVKGNSVTVKSEPQSPPQPPPSQSTHFPTSLPPPPPPPLPVPLPPQPAVAKSHTSPLPQPTHVKSIFSPEKASPVSAPPPNPTPPPPPRPLPPPPPPPPSASPPREVKSCLPVLTSPLKSPNTSHKPGRNRTSSSSSEPELVPVVQKLEDMSGFEGIGKGLKTAIKLPSKVPDLIHPTRDRKKEVISVSNVSKELKHVESGNSVQAMEIAETSVTEHSDTKETKESKSHKKKKKHKEHREHKEHKEHKDKDKDRDRDGRKQKHKEKHREKHKDPAPIKITIPKDKLNHILAFTPNTSPIQESSSSLKIKIPKERLVQQPQSGLKIKISKDVIVQSTNKDILPPMPSSRKRERSSHAEEESLGQPQKMPRGPSTRPNGFPRSSGSEVVAEGNGKANASSRHH